MDPLTHIILSRALVSRRREAALGALLPDLSWYVFYPAWLLGSGALRDILLRGVWPLPPRWLRTVHYASHSLLAVLAVLLHGAGPGRRRLATAWLVHILVDIPTHSRARMAPRPLWPFSPWSYDGFSWADWLMSRLVKPG